MTLEEFFRSEPTGRFEAMVCDIHPSRLTLRIKKAGCFYSEGIDVRVEGDSMQLYRSGVPIPVGWSVIEGDDDKLSREEMLRCGIDQ